MGKKGDIAPSIDTLVNDVTKIIEQGRQKGAEFINSVICMTNWNIGQRIVEEEQYGEKRAEYGKQLLKRLSECLTSEYGDNNSYTARDLRNCRQFYLTFGDFPKWYARVPNLTWTHYRSLLRVDNTEARNWYLSEAASQTWSTRTLDRNINSQYYFRLISSDKETVRAEMKAKMADYKKDKLEFLKNPIVAEFLGISQNPNFTETKLESSIIEHLQKFIMELGKGVLTEIILLSACCSVPKQVRIWRDIVSCMTINNYLLLNT